MNKADIICDDYSVKHALTRLVDVLKKNDCYFDRNIQIQCKNGDLGIFGKQPVNNGTALVSISEQCLVPVEDLTLKIKDNNIVLSGYDSSLSALRLQIIHELINVFNLTNKINHHVISHPAAINDLFPDLYNKLLEGRSVRENVYKISNKNKSDALIQQMLKSRTMLYKRADRKSNKKIDVIVPVIDFFNHHHSACQYTKSGTTFNNFKLSVLASFCNQKTMEYFVRYGQFDSYDTFLRYGYVDRDVNFLYSIPLTVTLPFFGQIVVHCITGQQQEGFNVNKNTINFLYLLIPGNDDPFSLRHKLYSAIREMGRNLSSDNINAYVQSAESIIIKRNIDFYEELKSYIPVASDNDRSINIISSVSLLINQQLHKLRSYQYL